MSRISIDPTVRTLIDKLLYLCSSLYMCAKCR